MRTHNHHDALRMPFPHIEVMLVESENPIDQVFFKDEVNTYSLYTNNITKRLGILNKP